MSVLRYEHGVERSEMSTETKLPTWEEALRMRGFVLREWRHDRFVKRVFGGNEATRTFTYGTMHGLVEHYAREKRLCVVALHNETIGNGHFARAIQHFEHVAEKLRLRLLVVQFENTRLAFWFERRSGWTRGSDKEFGEFAEYRAPSRPHFHEMPLARPALMTAQVYHDQKIVRVFDDGGPNRSNEAIADLVIPPGVSPSPQAGSRALMKIGLVRVGGWQRHEWGWQIEVQVRDLK